jgi:DNA-binding transcriptional regulator YiaG
VIGFGENHMRAAVQGRRQPSGTAQALIQIAFRHPEVNAETLS